MKFQLYYAGFPSSFSDLPSPPTSLSTCLNPPVTEPRGSSIWGADMGAADLDGKWELVKVIEKIGFEDTLRS